MKFPIYVYILIVYAFSISSAFLWTDDDCNFYCDDDEDLDWFTESMCDLFCEDVEEETTTTSNDTMASGTSTSVMDRTPVTSSVSPTTQVPFTLPSTEASTSEAAPSPGVESPAPDSNGMPAATQASAAATPGSAPVTQAPTAAAPASGEASSPSSDTTAASDATTPVPGP